MKQIIKRMKMLGYEIEIKSDERIKCFNNEEIKEFIEIIKADEFFILQICSDMEVEDIWIRRDEKEIYDLLIDLEDEGVI